MRGTACGPPPGEPCRQAFLTKLDPSGTSAAYSTYLGGREHDDAYGVAVDRRRPGTRHRQHPVPGLPVRNAAQPTLDNRACTSEQPQELCDDGFVTKFAADGQRWSTAPTSADGPRTRASASTVTAGAGALVAGRTDSTDFPTTADAAQPSVRRLHRRLRHQLRPSGHARVEHVPRREDADRATGIAADGRHRPRRRPDAVPDFPTVRPFQPELKDDDYDAFLSVIK